MAGEAVAAPRRRHAGARATAGRPQRLVAAGRGGAGRHRRRDRGRRLVAPRLCAGGRRARPLPAPLRRLRPRRASLPAAGLRGTIRRIVQSGRSTFYLPGLPALRRRICRGSSLTKAGPLPIERATYPRPVGRVCRLSPPSLIAKHGRGGTAHDIRNGSEMANTPSAKKAARKIAHQTAVNKVPRTRMRSFIRKVEEAIASGDKTAARAALKEAQPQIMKAAAQGPRPPQHRLAQSLAPHPSGRSARLERSTTSLDGPAARPGLFSLVRGLTRAYRECAGDAAVRTASAASASSLVVTNAVKNFQLLTAVTGVRKRDREFSDAGDESSPPSRKKISCDICCDARRTRCAMNWSR